MISEIIKNELGFSSGSMTNTAHFSLQNRSASISVSKHRICSSSESKNELRRDNAVPITLAMDSLEVFSAAPANHLALWSLGSIAMSCWNWFCPFCWEGARSSWMILNTETICLFCGSQNSATNKIVAVSRPSAAS